jgi:two-component system response regulator DesR
MPAMDGLTATQMLRSELPGVKVVMVTATTEDGQRAKALAAGALGYLTKDFETDDLFSLLERVERVPTLPRKPPGS